MIKRADARPGRDPWISGLRASVSFPLSGFRDRSGPWLAVSQPFGLGYPSRRLLLREG